MQVTPIKTFGASSPMQATLKTLHTLRKTRLEKDSIYMKEKLAMEEEHFNIESLSAKLNYE